MSTKWHKKSGLITQIKPHIILIAPSICPNQSDELVVRGKGAGRA